MNETFPKLTVTSSAFEHNGTIPMDYTGRGKDISPPLSLSVITENAKSVAVILDDITHPLFRIYNHWTLWNIPVLPEIPENISHGKIVSELGGAMQGIGYGRHRYRGPKPPFHTTHSYQYTVYVLDCMLELDARSRKRDLMEAMKGHILQQGFILGKYN